ncbi:MULTISPECIES: hypothetical protein [Bartonella]|uniref:hypothetical protein n=1 Tax=Bartonella TaxID=773 RepID=UPI001FEA2337|nr:hypothetical protein [Bartonella capreoli]
MRFIQVLNLCAMAIKKVNHRSGEDIRKALTMLAEEIAILEGYEFSYVYYLEISRGYLW